MMAEFFNRKKKEELDMSDNNKKINILVPCYNEEKSIIKLYDIITQMFRDTLKKYEYSIIFADDFSKDNTRQIIKELCSRDSHHVKAVFNAANFGLLRNVFEAFKLTDGDAVFLVFGDLQDPPELLPRFIEEWEKGNKVIIGQKQRSKENKFMFFMRKIYYKLIDIFSDKTQIKQYTGFGLYDRKFVDVLNEIDDMQPYLKQVVAEYAPNYKVISYQQNASDRGKSNYNFYRNFDFAMEGITSSTKKLMRLSTFFGVILGIFSALYAISVIIKKIIYWDSYPFGMASITVGIFFLGAMQLFFIGILGEYMLSINAKTLKRPRVTIEEKINFVNDKMCEKED